MEPSNKIPLKSCPVCGSDSLVISSSCSDFFLSGETFDLVTCEQCEVCFTNPQPAKHVIQDYYASKDYISHSSDSNGLIAKLYRMMRTYTIRQKYKLVTRYKQSGSILDIGCGTGHLLHEFARKGWSTKGIEPGSAPRNFGISNFGLDIRDEEGLQNFEKQSFDVVSMWHVLEHVHDTKERMNQVYQLLKPNGIAVVALPNYRSYDARYYGAVWAAWDVPRHLFHFSRKAFQKLAGDNGFSIITQYPMKFDAYYVSMLSEGYRHGRKRMISALFRGFNSNLRARHNGEYSSVIYILRKIVID